MFPGLDSYYEGLHQYLKAEVQHEALAAQQPCEVEGDANHHSSWTAFLQGLSHAAFHALGELTFDAAQSALLGQHTGPTVVGHPTADGFTHQTTGFTCAVVSQKMVLDQFHLIDPRTGYPLSEAQLTYEATVHGWLTDQGTSLNDLGKLLDHYGVSNHEGHNWHDLIRDLAQGHQVVMAVHAQTLWHDHSPWTELMNSLGHAPNHAIVVKGLTVDDHGHVQVTIHDPGSHDGAGKQYPLEHFQAALNSQQLTYVATDDAPPTWTSHPTLMGMQEQDSSPSPLAEWSDFPHALEQLSDADRYELFRSL